MKELMAVLLVLILMLAAPISSYALWVTANKATVMWDFNDTSDLEEDEMLVYRVFLANKKTDPNKTNPVAVGDTEENSFTVTLSEKGRYMAGVCAVLYVLNEDGVTWEEVAEGEVAWSDNPEVTKDGIVFGIRFYPAPFKPSGLSAG